MALQLDKLFNKQNCSVFLVFFLVAVIPLVAVDSDSNSNCLYKKTCDECLKTGPQCSWCASEDFVEREGGRCGDQSWHCPSTDALLNVRSSYKMEVVKDGKTGGEYPSTKVTIKLRDDEELKFKINVTSAPDLAYEMYFLLDGSRSMYYALKSIKKNSVELAKEVKKKWKNSEVGLGIFNDKETPPFTFTNFSNIGLKKNIPGFELPYWTMVTKLGVSDSEFSEEINKVSVKELYDPDGDPEATLDVVAQALSCKDALGFKENTDTRHLIFLTTDSPFWVAGDGRYGAIINPPIDECRGTDTTKQSEGSFLYDYPSVGFFKYLLLKKRVYVVASVTNDIFENQPYYIVSFAEINENIYSTLEAELEGLVEYVANAFDSRLTNKTEPLRVDAVMDKLDEISKRVSLVASGETDKLVIKTYIEKSTCPTYNSDDDPNPELDDSWKICKNVEKGHPVTISVSVRQKKGVNIDGPQNFYLNLPGVHPKNELVDVTVEHIEAECTDENCKKFDDAAKAADANVCKNGIFKCGACTCNDGWHGSNCDCETSEGRKKVTGDDDTCKGKGNQKENATCNGRGTCYCGECECGQNSFGNDYVGDTCQCDPSSCPTGSDGRACYGNGNCICVDQSLVCNCTDNNLYNATTYCKCKNENVCYDPYYNDGLICNGRSTGCECGGGCRCLNEFEGDYCEKCNKQACMARICDEKRYKQYVWCHFDPRNEACKTTVKIPDIYHKTVDTQKAQDQRWKRCSVKINEDCTALFYVNNDMNSTAGNNLFYVAIDENLKCKEPINIWLIVLIIVILVVLLGFAFIFCGKVYIIVQEKKEYKAFMKAQQGNMTSRGVNPLYKAAGATIDNPNYKSN